MSNEFLKPRFQGKRFEGHRIPLDVLSELALIEDLILQTAKWLFLMKNQGRKRVPRGWANGFKLCLTRIENGSAVTVLEIDAEMAPSDLLYLPELEEARDFLIEKISSVGSSLPSEKPDLPVHLKRHFKRIGATLADGEGIELTSPKSPYISGTLNIQTRRRLMPPSQPFFQRVEVVGLVFEVNQKKRTYQIQVEPEGVIDARFDDDHYDLVLEASNCFRKGELYVIRGNGLHRPDGTLKEIAETFEVEPAGQNISPLLAKLTSLEEGWLDSENGVVFENAHLQRLAKIWYDNVPAALPIPSLFPTEDGGVSAEWSFGRWDISLDVDPATQKGFFHALQLDTDEVHELPDLDLSLSEAWEEVVDLLLRLQEENGGV